MTTSVLREGENIFETIGQILTQIRPGLIPEGNIPFPGGDVDTKALEERETTLDLLSADESREFANRLIEGGEVGLRCLNTLLNKGRIRNLQLSEAEARNFLYRLLEGGEAGLRCLNTLLNRGRLRNFRLDETAPREFADRLIGHGEWGLRCLNTLLHEEGLRNLNYNELTPAQAREFAHRLIGHGEAGLECLNTLLNKGRIGNLQLSEAEATEFVDRLIGHGEAGLEYLNTLFDKGILRNFRLNEAESSSFAHILIGHGERGLECLNTLLYKGRLRNFRLDKAASREFADRLIGYGKVGLGRLDTLLNKGKLENLNYDESTPVQARGFADRLIGHGEAGLEYLNTLLNEGRIRNLNYNELTSAQAREFADRLIGHGEWGSRCLNTLLNEGRIRNLQLSETEARNFLYRLLDKNSWRSAECLMPGTFLNFHPENLDSAEATKFVFKVIDNGGKRDVEYLRVLIGEGKLPNFHPETLNSADAEKLADRILRKNSLEAVKLLGYLIMAEKLPNFNPAKNLMTLVRCGLPGMALLNKLVLGESPRIGLGELPLTQALCLAGTMIKEGGRDGAKHLCSLIEEKKLPNLQLPNKNISAFDASSIGLTVRQLLCEGGPYGAKCLRLLIEKGTFLPKNLDPAASKWLARTLLVRGAREGAKCLKFLLEQGKLPSLNLNDLSKNDSTGFLKNLFRCGPEGRECLFFILNQGTPQLDLLTNLKLQDLSETDSCFLAEELLGGREFGVKCFNILIEKGQLPGLKLDKLSEGALLQLDLHLFPSTQLTTLAETLFVSSPRPSLLVRLIEQNKLFFDPNSLFSKFPEQFETFAMASAGYGAFGGRLLTELTLVPDRPFFSLPETSKAFVHRLLRCSPSGMEFTTTLIEQGKLPHLALPVDTATQTYADKFRLLHLKLEGVIGNRSLGDVHSESTYMPLKEARRVWQGIANEVAVDCFDGGGYVNVEKLRTWMEFFGNAEVFEAIPYRFIPQVELMRSQIYTVCECLVANRNNVMDILNLARNIIPGPYGLFLLNIMSRGRKPLLTPAEAILASLFSLHRQLGLPTCTIDALISAEIRNHPERLILMYGQILRGGQFLLPSGFTVQLLPIVNDSITVDLKNGGRGKDSVFEDIECSIPSVIDERIKVWQEEGIKYVVTPHMEERYRLTYPVHNMNAVLFLHILQASNFGNWKIHGNNYGVTQIYAGHEATAEISIPMDRAKHLNGMAELKKQAEARQKLGDHFIYVGTNGTIYTIPATHAENIDIDALLALDLDNMHIGRAYPFGDRNWYNREISRDIPRLAIRRTDDTPTYEFGILNGYRFTPTNISTVMICDIDIQRRTDQSALVFPS
ncbi:MAG: hypothetical protein LBF49_03390 [Puniceicoccales bacterium]|nr:hypothetical protein [Puniceicoccales bacterium]